MNALKNDFWNLWSFMELYGTSLKFHYKRSCIKGFGGVGALELYILKNTYN